MKLLYLIIDLSALAVPLIFSFHPKINFYISWTALSKAIGLNALLFLAFDSIFTACGIWSFNPQYITGIYVFNLPIEEVLFFICIPYSCLFTYYCLNKFYTFNWNLKAEDIFCALFSTVLLITGIIFWRKIYTSSTFISTAVLCLFLKFYRHIPWFGKAVSVYAILIFPFFLINGVLTGTGLSEPVVKYNPDYILGIRFMTIPVEDFVYGFELFLLNLSLYLRFNKQFLLGNSYNISLGTELDNGNSNDNYKVE
jgi:lycopene cyclase domain-containing protein